MDRNIHVIHGYDSLRDEILWAIVIKDLPLLKGEIEALIDHADNGQDGF